MTDHKIDVQEHNSYELMMIELRERHNQIEDLQYRNRLLTIFAIIMSVQLIILAVIIGAK